MIRGGPLWQQLNLHQVGFTCMNRNRIARNTLQLHEMRKKLSERTTVG